MLFHNFKFYCKKTTTKKAYFLLCEGLYFITNNILIKKNQHLINNVFIYLFFTLFITLTIPKFDTIFRLKMPINV